MLTEMSTIKAVTVRRFFDRFPDDSACLDHILELRFGTRHSCRACERETTFHRIGGRRAFACARCGDHLFPCAGTIFEDSRTPLQLWFYAIFLFAVTRRGVSAKELQRSLGVTYKTAWRMGHQIRDLMAKAELLLAQGENSEEPRNSAPSPTENGDLRDRQFRALSPSRQQMINAQSAGTSVTNAAAQFDSATMRFAIAVRSTYGLVSPQHLHRYFNEFLFRSHHRVLKNAMFDRLLRAL